jgi:hypothetical protein
MTPPLRTPKSSNRVELFTALFLFALFFSGTARAQFKSDHDRTIVHDILKAFSHECVQRGSIDAETLKRLDVEAKDVSRTGNLATQKCFENHYSQVAGVSFLYQRLCHDISFTARATPDELAATQFLQVNKYQTGIRPYQSTLNDCLVEVPDKKGLAFFIPLSGFDLNVKALQKEIDEIRIVDPFAATFPVPAR